METCPGPQGHFDGSCHIFVGVNGMLQNGSEGRILGRDASKHRRPSLAFTQVLTILMYLEALLSSLTEEWRIPRSLLSKMVIS